MTGIPADAHEWISFEDDEEHRTWVFDVTFFDSPWTCIFGRGCQGVLTAPAPEMLQGCCSYGAHFVDDDDVARVVEAAGTLTDDQWQFRKQGMKRGVVKTTRDGDTVTRLVDDACIFLNRAGFERGPGCALHVAAMDRGLPHLALKPDVCWQVPIRREEREDGGGHVTTFIGQWGRRHWGEGGDEFAWWCTEAPEAFVGTQPAYRELADELVALCSRPVYEKFVAYMERRNGRLRHPQLRVAGV